MQGNDDEQLTNNAEPAPAEECDEAAHEQACVEVECWKCGERHTILKRAFDKYGNTKCAGCYL